MTLFVIPIESYDIRYTEQWNRWFPEIFTQKNVDFKYLSIIDKNDDISLGEAVLDPVRTNRYRTWQIDRILKMFEKGVVKDGDVFFFHTLWFPGIETLAYVRDICKINFRIVAVLHAGSYDPWDFRALSGMDPWAAPLETSWLNIVDRVILATEFHRELLLSHRSVDPEKLFVTGLPFLSDEIRNGRNSSMKEKKNLIAFPHRIALEKNYELVDFLRSKFGEKSVVITRDLTKSKSEYLDLVSTCKICVSDSLQETFGYSMLEATALGCVPLVPDKLCYKEMYPQYYRFSSREQLIDKISEIFKNDSISITDLSPLIKWADSSMERILEVVLSW